MKPGGSKPHLQELSNKPYPEPNQPNTPHQGPFYEGQSISNASYFFSPLLFKKTQILSHSLKTVTLTINLSLFNIISVHFHHFGLPFNKGMYSSKVLSPKPLMHERFHLVCPSASLQRRTHRLTVLTSTAASPYTFFSLSWNANGHFTFCSQEFNHRTLSNTGWNTCPC